MGIKNMCNYTTKGFSGEESFVIMKLTTELIKGEFFHVFREKSFEANKSENKANVE